MSIVDIFLEQNRKFQLSLGASLETIDVHTDVMLREAERASQRSSFTDHGRLHIQAVLHNLERLIPYHLYGSSEHQINPYELLILIGAAKLHDWGMLYPEQRATHNVVSAQKVYDPVSGRSGLSGLDIQYAQHISKLCLAHRDYTNVAGDRVNTLVTLENKYLAGYIIKLPLLACLLRLADELDLDYQRASQDTRLRLDLPTDAQEHWDAHQNIDSVNIWAPRWEIEVIPNERVFHDERIKHLLRQRIAKLQSELTKMQSVFQKTHFAYKTITVKGLESTEMSDHSTFTDSVAELFQICGYAVETAELAGTVQYDMKVYRQQSIEKQLIIIRCIEDRPTEQDIIDFSSVLEAIFPAHSIPMYVSASNFGYEFSDLCRKNRVSYRSYNVLVSEMINFTEYRDRVLDDKDLKALETQYQVPKVQTIKGVKKLDAFMEDWLASNNNWLTVLGDYGIGKTTFLRIWWLRLMRKYKEDPERNPIPIFVPLQNFVKAFDFKNLILAVFSEMNMGGVYFEAFENWVQRGRIILLLDSFDEMAQKLNREEIHNNLRELLKGITGKSKAILTSRPTYFESNAERLTLVADLGLIQEDNEDYALYETYSSYDFELQDNIRRATEVQLMDLTQDQVQQYFARVLEHDQESLSKIHHIAATISGIDQMMSRPAIMRLLIVAAPGLKITFHAEPGLERFTESDMFALIVEALLERDRNLYGLELPDSERHRFLKRMAYYISQRGRENYISNQELHSLVEDVFQNLLDKSTSRASLAEQLFRACRRAAGLAVEPSSIGLAGDLQNPNSRVGFSHNALREYLYAEYIRDHLKQSNTVQMFQNSTLSSAVYIFLKDMISPDDMQYMTSHIQSMQDEREFFFKICWNTMPNLERNEIETILGIPPSFNELDLSDLNLSQRDLHDATFRDALIGGVNFRDSNLDSADFAGSVIQDALFDGASLIQTQFRGADILSIVVYDGRAKREVKKMTKDARQWLFTEGSSLPRTSELNVWTRSRKYQAAQKIVGKMKRFEYVRGHVDRGLLKSLTPDEFEIGKEFMDLMLVKGYIMRVIRSKHSGRDAWVVQVPTHKRDLLTGFYLGTVPEDLQAFFDDADFS